MSEMEIHELTNKRRVLPPSESRWVCAARPIKIVVVVVVVVVFV